MFEGGCSEVKQPHPNSVGWGRFFYSAMSAAGLLGAGLAGAAAGVAV